MHARQAVASRLSLVEEVKTCVVVYSSYDVVTAGLSVLLGSHPRIDLRIGGLGDVVVHGAQVVLYDVIGLHDGDGSDLDRLVKETDVAVLAVTRDLRPDLADRAIEKGVDGCVSVDAPVDELVAAVEAAAWGDLHGDRSPEAVDFTINPATPALDVGLSPREAEMLRMITAGFSNLQIAEELYLSINSVKTYIRSAYRRIGVQNRTQAAVWSMQHGFGSDDPGPDDQR